MRRSNAIWALLALLAVAHVAAAARAPGRRQRVKAANDAPAAAGNPKPLIGILTQPCHYCPGKSYIGSAYVKMVEMAGGRAVPVRFYASDEELYRIFKSINGLIFPGGLTWLWLDSPYVLAARKLWNWAREENDKGNPFPIHGTCLGHQLLHILPSNVSRNYLLVDTDSVAHPANLEWTAGAESTRFFSTMPEDLKAKLADPKLNIALENHMYGIPPSHYERWPDLKDEFTIVSTTKDRNGTEYISTVEGKKYPFTGTQWHPEKPPFEFGMEEVPHTLDAIRVSQHIANNFIEVARKSQHFPISNEEGLALQIYSTPLTFSARFEVFDEEQYDGPDSTYYFDEKDPEFPPGPDPEDAPDAEFTASSGTQQEARSEQHESHSHAEGRVDNAPRHLRTHKGARFFNARQMEAFFT